MGRIARATGMGILRGCVGCPFIFVYVVGVCFAFFFIPLGRWGDRLNPDPKDLILPLGLGFFFLLVGPALLAAVGTRRRNARFDAIFAPLGLAGFPFALQYRRYDGTFAGRRLQAFVSRGPRIVLEADTAVATRFGITADAGDTKLLAGLVGERPIGFAVPAFDGLVVFGKEEAWVRRLFAEPGVPTLLARLLLFDGPLARRQVVLRPGALTLTFQLTTAFLRWIPSPGQARDWAEALVELARIAERVPAPVQPLAPTPLEQRIGSIRGLGLKVNPGVAALVAILATPLLAGAIAGVTILAGRACAPARGPGSRVEAFEVLDQVYRSAHSLQVAELRAIDLLGDLGTLEREDDSALHASARVPAGARLVIAKSGPDGVGREVEWTFAAPPAIRMRDLEERWGKPVSSPAPDGPKAVVAVFATTPGAGARWPVRVRVRFDGGVAGPVARIAVYREPAR